MVLWTYVPLVVVVWLLLMVTVLSPGLLQQVTPSLKLTVWLPTERPDCVNPLLCQLPSSTRHCAPAETAPDGKMLTLNEPDPASDVVKLHSSAT